MLWTNPTYISLPLLFSVSNCLLVFRRLKEGTASIWRQSTQQRCPLSTRCPKLWMELCWLWRALACYRANTRPGERVHSEDVTWHFVNHGEKNEFLVLLLQRKHKQDSQSWGHIPVMSCKSSLHELGRKHTQTLTVTMGVFEECGLGMLSVTLLQHWTGLNSCLSREKHYDPQGLYSQIYAVVSSLFLP